MIKLGDSSILILKADGTKFIFDHKELQKRIAKSCVLAEVDESWIAEDISLSIEYALTQQHQNDEILTAGDLNSIVVSILENAGYPQVAQAYLKENSTIQLELTLEPHVISKIIARHLGLLETPLIELTNEVVSACEQLRLEEATPVFILELAKTLQARMGNQAYRESLVAKLSKRKSSNSSWALPSEKIIKELKNSELISLLDDDILAVMGVSRLFPSIRISFNFNRYVEQLKLVAPLTELELIPYFYEIAKGVNELIRTVYKLYSQQVSNSLTLPIYLSVPDMSLFSVNFLQVDWIEGEKCCRDIIVMLEEMLEYPVFKLDVQ
jgi:hypothetical protein